MAVNKKEKLEVTLMYHHDTDKGVQVSSGIPDEENRYTKHWLPKSQVETDVPISEMDRMKAYTFRVPLWLLEEKGLEDTAG